MPLHLALVVSLAWAMIFLGYLPTQSLRDKIIRSQILGAGLAWMGVALISPHVILHFYILIGLFCLVSWWQLQGNHGLRGKLWLVAASATAISLGVIVILGTNSKSFPPEGSAPSHLFLLASIYLGGAITGLSYSLFVLTRPSIAQTEIPSRLVERYAGLLVALTIARLALLFGAFIMGSAPLGNWCWVLACCAILLCLASLAKRQIYSRVPSSSGPALLGLCLTGLVAEIIARTFGL